MRISSKNAFTIVELLIALSIIAIILAVAVQNYATSREESHKNGCMANLKQINSAVDRWALDNKVAAGTIPSESEEDDIYTYLKGSRPRCPGGGIYTIHGVGNPEQVTCSLTEKGHRI